MDRKFIVAVAILVILLIILIALIFNFSEVWWSGAYVNNTTEIPKISFPE